MKKLFNLLSKKKSEDALKCPRCGKIMKKINKDNVIIDICTRCRGMWLDDKEVEKLVAKGVKNAKK